MREESLALLRPLHELVINSKTLEAQDEALIKSTFKKILEGGDTYNMMELEKWFASRPNDGSRQVIDRMMNIAHYQKSKFDASNKFRMVSDGDDCSCGCGGH